MSKVAEQKALEAYPFEPIECGGGIADSNSEYRGLYQEGYDQAMQDMARDADRLQYLSDELGYAYACGCKKTMQDLLEKAESFIEKKVSDYFWWNQEECFVDFDKEECIKNFKNYMKNES